MSNEKIIATPADGVTIIHADLDAVEALEREVLDEHGRQTPQAASVYAKYSDATRATLCVKHGIYGLVTHELVEFIREHIGHRTAIEIGSGDGVLAKALDIPATDNRMQEWADIRSEYERLMQAPVKYGASVELLDGADAVTKYAPQVIVANWLTHRYKDTEHGLGGNMYAPDELMLLANCETLIFAGNTSSHRNNRLLKRRHLHFEYSWQYSRAVRGRNFVGVWKGGKV